MEHIVQPFKQVSLLQTIGERTTSTPIHLAKFVSSTQCSTCKSNQINVNFFVYNVISLMFTIIFTGLVLVCDSVQFLTVSTKYAELGQFTLLFCC